MARPIILNRSHQWVHQPPVIYQSMGGDWITSNKNSTAITGHPSNIITNRFLTTGDKKGINATTNNLVDFRTQFLAWQKAEEGEGRAANKKLDDSSTVVSAPPNPSFWRPQADSRANKKTPFVPLEDSQKNSSLGSYKKSDASKHTAFARNGDNNNNNNNNNKVPQNGDKDSQRPLQPSAANPSRFRALLEEEQQQQQQQQHHQQQRPNRKVKRLLRRQRRQLRRQQQQQQQQQQYQHHPVVKTVGLLLRRRKQWVPHADWVVITNTSPQTSLETVLEGVNDHLDQILLAQLEESQQQQQQQQVSSTKTNNSGGIVDLDAPWDPDDYRSALMAEGVGDEGHLHLQQMFQNLPTLDLPDMFPAIKFMEETTGDNDDEIPGMALEEKLSAYQPLEDVYRWVDEARVMLSPRGRPAGWKIKFLNRSIIYAFLNSTQERALMCSWRVVAAQEWSPKVERDIMPPELTPKVTVSFDKVSTDEKFSALEPIGNNRSFYDELELDPLRMNWLDDSVVRVENCSEQVSEQDLLHVFSRYDLKSPSVVRWVSGGSDVTRDPIPSFFVRFAGASWARAAVREKQSTIICGKAIRLIQFPRQLIRTKHRQGTAKAGAATSKVVPQQAEEEEEGRQQSMTAE